MNSFLRFLPIAVLMTLAIVISPGVRAQGLDSQLAQTGNNNLVAPVSQLGTQAAFGGINEHWLLPLILVGLGILLLGGSRERLERRYYTPKRDYSVAYHDISGEKKRKTNQMKRLKKPLKSSN
jgi:hypothetical protein